MGQIVAAMATMHAPQLFTRPPEEDPRQLDAGIAAMRRLGKVLDETKPDALIIFASDHMETFFLKSVPTFAIMSCENATAAFAGRSYNPPIHQGLAEAVLDQLVARDFDMAYSQEAELGHSFAAIFEWVLEGRAIPVVPIFINTYLPPLPSARRCAALGKAIARNCGFAARARGRARERRHVALSGHLEVLHAGVMISIAGASTNSKTATAIRSSISSAEQLDEVGNTEMLPWAAVLGAVGPQHMELLSYQATTHHGHAVAIFHPGEKLNADPPRPYTFHNHPYHFYNHPPLAAYKLNKLLYDLRFKPSLRMRAFHDVTPIAREYGLSKEHTAALQETFMFLHIDTATNPGRTRIRSRGLERIPSARSWPCIPCSRRSAS